MRDIADEEGTHGSFMYNLLARSRKRLAQDRVHAVRSGRSVAGYMESLANETETQDDIKPKIDDELDKAKEAGLNFNVLCNMWLYDVGVMQDGKKSSDVSRFLNRLLGMNLKRQKFMTEYFMKSLENEVNNAKRAGTYDIGIRTLRGNNVEFPDDPRTFTFGGIAAKDARVNVFKVAQDTGTTPELAMELYEEAQNDASIPTSRSTWIGRGQRHDIVSGFYMDSRPIWRASAKVFLIINSGMFIIMLATVCLPVLLSLSQCRVAYTIHLRRPKH